MRSKVFMTAALAAVLVTAAYAGAQARQEGRQHAQGQHGQGHGHDAHAEGVDERGDRVMGFGHRKTTHRFTLHPDGGSIEVTAKEAGDGESRDSIRKHLAHVARMFAEGNFKAPMLIHDRVPPGVPAMRRLKAKIEYEYEDLERGGRVRIRTAHAEALRAVHEFLRFQIEDHRTGDPTEVRPLKPGS